MNNMMLVPSTRPFISCAIRPNYFPYDLTHNLLYLGFFMRCRIPISSPVSSSNTLLIICVRNFFLAGLSGLTFSCAVSTHANIASWVNDRKRVLVLVLYDGACRVSMLLLFVYSTLGNASSFIFGYAADMNLSDCQGGITIGGGWVFLLLGSDGCCIGLSTLWGGLVLLINGVD